MFDGHGNHECVASIFGFCKTLIVAKISNVIFSSKACIVLLITFGKDIIKTLV